VSLLFFIPPTVITAATVSGKVPVEEQHDSSEVEGFIRGFFDDQLTSASNQNMTDCMTRLLCENICQQTVQGKIKLQTDNLIPASQILGAQSGQMGYFFGGGDNGHKYGLEKNCQKCHVTYPNCLAAPYGQAKGVSEDYEKNMFNNLEPDFNSGFD